MTARTRSPLRRIYELCCELLDALEQFDKTLATPQSADVQKAVSELQSPLEQLRPLLHRHRPRLVRALDQREPSGAFTAHGPTTPDALLLFADTVASLTPKIEWHGVLSYRGELAHNEWSALMQAFRDGHGELRARLQLEATRLVNGPGSAAPPKQRGTTLHSGRVTLSQMVKTFRVPYSTLTDRLARHNRRNKHDEIKPVEQSRPLVFLAKDLERLLHPSERKRRTADP